MVPENLAFARHWRPSLYSLEGLHGRRARLVRSLALLQAQVDAVNLLAGAKTQSNPENCVGVLSLAGNVPKMLVTPTPDLGKILNSLHVVQIDGSMHFGTGVQARAPWRVVCHLLFSPCAHRCSFAQVAQLALKHRQNKDQRQRIVVFVGSPIAEDEVCCLLPSLSQSISRP